MTGTDPAIEAARRADFKTPSYQEYEYGDLIAAAREALKPIRELHKPVPCCPGDACDMLLCSTCHDPHSRNLPMRWPCPTARLIYTTTELENPDD